MRWATSGPPTILIQIQPSEVVRTSLCVVCLVRSNAQHASRCRYTCETKRLTASPNSHTHTHMITPNTDGSHQDRNIITSARPPPPQFLPSGMWTHIKSVGFGRRVCVRPPHVKYSHTHSHNNKPPHAACHPKHLSPMIVSLFSRACATQTIAHTNNLARRWALVRLCFVFFISFIEFSSVRVVVVVVH